MLAQQEKNVHHSKRNCPMYFSVTQQTINNWTSDIDKQNKAERSEKIFDMWLACYSENTNR